MKKIVIKCASSEKESILEKSIESGVISSLTREKELLEQENESLKHEVERLQFRLKHQFIGKYLGRDEAEKESITNFAEKLKSGLNSLIDSILEEFLRGLKDE